MTRRHTPTLGSFASSCASLFADGFELPVAIDLHQLVYYSTCSSVSAMHYFCVSVELWLPLGLLLLCLSLTSPLCRFRVVFAGGALFLLKYLKYGSR